MGKINFLKSGRLTSGDDGRSPAEMECFAPGKSWRHTIRNNRFPILIIKERVKNWIHIYKMIIIYTFINQLSKIAYLSIYGGYSLSKQIFRFLYFSDILISTCLWIYNVNKSECDKINFYYSTFCDLNVLFRNFHEKSKSIHQRWKGWSQREPNVNFWKGKFSIFAIAEIRGGSSFKTWGKISIQSKTKF